jgi:uncharacterized protein (DUF58 family)
MTGAAFLFAQAAAAAAVPSATQPDIAVTAHVEARSVKVEQDGRATLSLHAQPSAGAEPVRVERSAPPGRKHYRNLTIDLKAEARIADPSADAQATIASSQQGEPNHADQP